MGAQSIGRIEGELCQIWSEILQRDEVGVDDSFVALGGESLPAARVLLEIRERFRVEISLSQFYAARTVRKLALLIESLLARGGDPGQDENSDEGFL